MTQRLDLSYCITWEGRWHVGSGYQSAVADRLLRRLGGTNDAPFVPGSQIKGVLRYQCERLACALDLEVVNPHAGIEEDEKDLVKHFKPLTQSTLIIDRLFGSRFQGECLFVTNAVPVLSNGTEKRTGTSVQPRTALDRVTGTVMEQHLFTTEFSEAGPCLHGTIRARHPAGVLTPYQNGFPYEYMLLLVVLLSLDTLGGDKSTGLGRCKVEIQENTLLWNSNPIPLDEVLTGFREALAEWKEFNESGDDFGDLLELLREENTT